MDSAIRKQREAKIVILGEDLQKIQERRETVHRPTEVEQQSEDDAREVARNQDEKIRANPSQQQRDGGHLLVRNVARFSGKFRVFAGDAVHPEGRQQIKKLGRANNNRRDQFSSQMLRLKVEKRDADDFHQQIIENYDDALVNSRFLDDIPPKEQNHRLENVEREVNEAIEDEFVDLTRPIDDGAQGKERVLIKKFTKREDQVIK